MGELYCKENHPIHPKLSAVRMRDKFFAEFMENIETRAAWDILNKFKKDGVLENYRRVARGEQGEHCGYPWFHGLICECIRGISDLLVFRYDSGLHAELDALIALIAEAAAADPEGYLNPYTTLVCPKNRYGRNGGDAIRQHETYNAGCLAEAGVHHYLATGKTALLQVAVNQWNGMAAFIGKAPRHEVAPEHSLPEEALVKLSEVLEADTELCKTLGGRPAEYRRLAAYFIDSKGHWENRYSYPAYFGEYAQDHCPARDQRFAVGHAVRATLFYTGMATVAACTGDEALARAALALWRDITGTKLHANGCVGATRQEEKFGGCYHLPNNAYLETCAGIGFAFFGYRLFEIYPNSEIFDEVEGTLRNLVPASISAEFDRYTYENPLCSDGSFERWEWHKCPCCPPMLLKITGMLPQYIYGRMGNDLYVNLYLDSEWREADFTLSQEGRGFSFRTAVGGNYRILLRVPRYARNFRICKNGKTVCGKTENGYMAVPVDDGDRVEVSFIEPICKYGAHPYVKADRNKVMIKQGATLYCLEEIDAPWAFDETGEVCAVLDDATPLTMDGTGNILGKDTEGRTLTFTPYYRWNNRDKGKMTVWIGDSAHKSDPMRADDFGKNLYRPVAEYTK